MKDLQTKIHKKIEHLQLQNTALMDVFTWIQTFF